MIYWCAEKVLLDFCSDWRFLHRHDVILFGKFPLIDGPQLCGRLCSVFITLLLQLWIALSFLFSSQQPSGQPSKCIHQCLPQLSIRPKVHQHCFTKDFFFSRVLVFVSTKDLQKRFAQLKLLLQTVAVYFMVLLFPSLNGIKLSIKIYIFNGLVSLAFKRACIFSKLACWLNVTSDSLLYPLLKIKSYIKNKHYILITWLLKQLWFWSVNGTSETKQMSYR